MSASKDKRFPHAPVGWTLEIAMKNAREEGFMPGDDHWDAVRALQEYFARHAEEPKKHEFHYKGGMRYLYSIFPKGPVAQGCRLAGLQAPAGSVDKGFGSVV